MVEKCHKLANPIAKQKCFDSEIGWDWIGSSSEWHSTCCDFCHPYRRKTFELQVAVVRVLRRSIFACLKQCLKVPLIDEEQQPQCSWDGSGSFSLFCLLVFMTLFRLFKGWTMIIMSDAVKRCKAVLSSIYLILFASGPWLQEWQGHQHKTSQDTKDGPALRPRSCQRWLRQNQFDMIFALGHMDSCSIS